MEQKECGGEVGNASSRRRLGNRSLKCRQVRGGPAGAVMWETRDRGIKWPQWHTMMFEGQVAVDMRVTCRKDVKTGSLDRLLEEMGSQARV